MRKAVVTITVLAIIIIGSIYFFERSSSQVAPTQSPTTEVTTEPTAPEGTSGTTSANQTENSITLTQSGFSPATITIKAGQTITWMNKSGTAATVNSNPHPTHIDYPPLNLGQFSDGSSLTLTFPTPGTYGYHNHLNPSETGTIIVQ